MSGGCELDEIEQFCRYKIDSTNNLTQLSLQQQMRDLYILLLRITHEIRKVTE